MLSDDNGFVESAHDFATLELSVTNEPRNQMQLRDSLFSLIKDGFEQKDVRMLPTCLHQVTIWTLVLFIFACCHCINTEAVVCPKHLVFLTIDTNRTVFFFFNMPHRRSLEIWAILQNTHKQRLLSVKTETRNRLLEFFAHLDFYWAWPNAAFFQASPLAAQPVVMQNRW